MNEMHYRRIEHHAKTEAAVKAATQLVALIGVYLLSGMLSTANAQSMQTSKGFLAPPFLHAKMSTLFQDDFDRSNSTTVGNSWSETDGTGSAEAQISGNRLDFNANDEAHEPLVSHTFTKQTTGRVRLTYTFNFERTGSESTFEVRMQLGENALMVSPSTSDNTGVAVNLVWAGPNRGLTTLEGFGYDQAASITEIGVVSGDAGANSGGDAVIVVIADLDSNTFDVTISGDGLISGDGVATNVAFDNNVDIDAVRIYLDEINDGNFGDLEIDDLSVELLENDAATSGALRALAYDGVDDYVNLGDLPTDGLSELSVEAWVNHLDSGDDRIVCKSTGGNISDHTFSLGLYNNRLRARINGTGDYDASTVLSTDTWYHVAFTYDGSDLLIFLNGVRDDSSGASHGTVDVSAQTVTVGNVNTVDDRYFYGYIDEVRVWSKALTRDEIRTNMCRRLDGDETGLIGYWRFDESTGSVASDASSNSNDGTLVNMTNDDWVWSGAALGDTSIYDYSGSIPSNFSLSLDHADGDSMIATGDGGTFDGMHLYQVNSSAMRPDASAPTFWNVSRERTWGVFAVGSSPTYSLTYMYDGHPGIASESNLALAGRDNHADDTWSDDVATLNTTANTLARSSLSTREFALGSAIGDSPLPVSLSAFAARTTAEGVTLSWRTESELQNLGFIVMRAAASAGPYRELASYLNTPELQGHFTSNITREYYYLDHEAQPGATYWYKLYDVDANGRLTGHGPLQIIFTESSPTDGYRLSANYPNPFNAGTTIAYHVPRDSRVNLTIYNLLGESVRSLVSGLQTAGEKSVRWDGRGDNGVQVSSGIYVYRLKAAGVDLQRKLLLIK